MAAGDTEFKLDSAGITEFLQSNPGVIAAVNAAAASAAASYRGRFPVNVRTYTTDRAAAAVSVEHPAGLREEAKHGHLTRAMSSAGLEVRSK